MTKVVEIDGVKYNVDVEEAKRLGVIKPIRKNVDAFTIGDVFANSTRAQIVVVKPIWSDFPKKEKCYAFIGCFGKLKSYSGGTELMTHAEVIAYINENKLYYKGNVSEDFFNAVKNVTGDDFVS